MFDHVSIGVVRQRFFGIPATDTDIISAQYFWTGGLETAGPGCYDAVARPIARRRDGGNHHSWRRRLRPARGARSRGG